MKEIKVLGVRMDNLTQDELREYCRQKLEGNKFCQIATVNPEFLVYAQKDQAFQKLLNRTDLNICDGAGISILMKLLYGKKIIRIAGVDVAEIICEICAEQGKSIFFLGGYRVSDIAAQRMQQKYPKLIVAGTLDGDENTLDEVKQCSPSAILVAFGSPKQEHWLAQKPKDIPSLRIGIGVGGTFDFWSGKVRRAPSWMQKIGCEWLYRLITQPKRIARIFRAVVVFPSLMIKEKIERKNKENSDRAK